MIEAFLVLVLAFLLDLVMGDPAYPFHPVRLMGRLVSFLEHTTRRIGWDSRLGGVILFSLSQSVVLCILFLLSKTLEAVHPVIETAFALFVCYSLIAFKDLVNHIGPVIEALEKQDLEGTRKAVSLVVGRDVTFLDRPGLCRAAIETLAENFVDGFLSPVFWYVIGALLGEALDVSPVLSGLCLMTAFKVTSTMDSMLGYRHEPYLRIGWAGARMDDLMNFIPARLSVAPLSISAMLTGCDLGSGLRTFLRDRLKHDSPNAAHGESFVSGALHVRLGGPTRYAGGMKDKPWLGDEFPDPEPSDIKRSLSLIRASAWAAILLGTLICNSVFRHGA